jgi:hypothetical protein
MVRRQPQFDHSGTRKQQVDNLGGKKMAAACGCQDPHWQPTLLALAGQS